MERQFSNAFCFGRETIRTRKSRAVQRVTLFIIELIFWKTLRVKRIRTFVGNVFEDIAQGGVVSRRKDPSERNKTLRGGWYASSRWCGDVNVFFGGKELKRVESTRPKRNLHDAISLLRPIMLVRYSLGK